MTADSRKEPVWDAARCAPASAPEPHAASDGAGRAAVLEVRERGRHLAQAVPITRWPCTLGRAAHADAVLTDPALSYKIYRICQMSLDFVGLHFCSAFLLYLISFQAQAYLF